MTAPFPARGWGGRYKAHKCSREFAEEAAAEDPALLVGREVSCFWQEEKTWYSGTLASYDSRLGTYTVMYEDGDTEEGVQLPDITVFVHNGDPTPQAPQHPNICALGRRALRKVSGKHRVQVLVVSNSQLQQVNTPSASPASRSDTSKHLRSGALCMQPNPGCAASQTFPSTSTAPPVGGVRARA